jgi:hypothetical protein
VKDGGERENLWLIVLAGGAWKQRAGRSARLTRRETGPFGVGIRVDQVGTISGLGREGCDPSCGDIL